MGLFDYLEHAGEALGREAVAELAKKLVPPKLSREEKKRLHEEKKKEEQRLKDEEERRKKNPDQQQQHHDGGEGQEYSQEGNYTEGQVRSKRKTKRCMQLRGTQITLKQM